MNAALYASTLPISRFIVLVHLSCLTFMVRFQTKTCNNGLVAARPGFSRFGSGTALHISASDDYAWLRANGDKFNFRNTLPAVGK